MKHEGLRSVVGNIAQDLASQIQSGKLAPGLQLPTERELATTYATSRAVVRRGLEALEKEGLITRKVGRGTFVSEPMTMSTAVLKLGDISPANLAIARVLIEPNVAEYAAVHATDSDLRFIEECLRQSDAANDAVTFDHWDLQLHVAIATAAHNSFIDFTMRGISEIRNTVGWTRITVLTATSARREIHKKDHRAIVEALTARDAAGAREAMRRHLQKVMQFMLGSTNAGEPVSMAE
jgi:DNA-binding FadR family transcriptional regulator